MAAKKRRSVYVVITSGRIFAFGSWEAAATFRRRAARLPSMTGQTVEFVSARVFKGRRLFAESAMPRLVAELEAEFRCPLAKAA